ncbi:GatB/YqeY motif [Glarea lozoyensis ATCC 20868]|uniref:Altered inheritance of mitochondria protein 41 n=1 Tax=Glarea lozoyensis (strain ATCC 20868 / MF5171) TaxID=1116229 RepID=S3DH20_GLAL2|nr:GatB/YqeY motif [Glarea lozoyensis ATCC 20868]EPE31306.1 GatB/YqeY motif [Glarea lozoyensis ATCC 20868]
MNILRASRLARLTLIPKSYSTTTTTTPPMLLKIRKDLKTAMQQKDTPRLTVLRALLASTLNASKTSAPINTDMQMLALLRKNLAASQAAQREFEGAGRADLVEKEGAQIQVMEEYVGGVEVVGEEEVRGVVGEVVRGLGEGAKMGEVMKGVGERLEGRNWDKGVVAGVVREVLGGK